MDSNRARTVQVSERVALVCGACLEHGEAEAPYVGDGGVVLADDALGAHVGDGADERHGLAYGVLDLAANAKVRDLRPGASVGRPAEGHAYLHLAARIYKEVLRLDVAVDEVQVLVNVVQAPEELRAL